MPRRARAARRLPSPLSSRSSTAASSGLAREPLLLDDDREPEVDRQHDAPQRPVVLGDEVVERGHHAVARAALVDGVVHRRVQAAAAAAAACVPGRMPALRVRLAELLRDPLGRVVEVAPAVRPADVVQDQDRAAARPAAARRRASILQLVVDRVPVVVAVDRARRPSAARCGQHVVADVAVEDVAARERALVLGGIELGHRVDDVQLGLGPEALEHQHRSSRRAARRSRRRAARPPPRAPARWRLPRTETSVSELPLPPVPASDRRAAALMAARLRTALVGAYCGTATGAGGADSSMRDTLRPEKLRVSRTGSHRRKHMCPRSAGSPGKRPLVRRIRGGKARRPPDDEGECPGRAESPLRGNRVAECDQPMST